MNKPKSHKTAEYSLIALQHVFVSNVWLDPIYVATAGGLSLAYSSNLVNTIFIISGLVTLLQVTRLIKLPVIQGPSASFDALMISAAKTGQLSAAGSSILLSSFIVLLLSVTGLITKLVKFLSPAVKGVLIFIVGLSLINFTLSEFFGGTPGTHDFASPHNIGLALITCATVLLFSLFGKGIWKRFSFLFALIAGDITAYLTGSIDFSGVKTQAWFGLPHFLPYGQLHFNWSVFIAFFIAYLVAVVESISVYETAGNLLGENIEASRIRNGIVGEALGSISSSLFGGFPTTGFAQNLGVLSMTSSFSHVPIMIAGVFFIILGFIPKIGALLALTPSSVIGGLFLPAAATLISAGLSILRQVEDNPRNNLVMGLPIILAIGLPSFSSNWSGPLAILLSNGILIGALTSVTLQLLLINFPKFLEERLNHASK